MNSTESKRAGGSPTVLVANASRQSAGPAWFPGLGGPRDVLKLFVALVLALPANFGTAQEGDESPQVEDAKPAAAPATGSRFRDCAQCPEMAVAPAGAFIMGDAEIGLDERTATIASPFAIGVHEVTFAQWNACVEDGGCGGDRPNKEGFDGDAQPVVNVSWDDAQAYVRWLSRKTSQAYRLPNETEWEYAARSGIQTAYSWGDEAGSNRANCDGCGSYWDGKITAPVGSFAANAWGLYDMHGNVHEWTQSCWEGPPNFSTEGCMDHVLRGGSYLEPTWMVRAAFRYGYAADVRGNFIGFRVARDLTP